MSLHYWKHLKDPKHKMHTEITKKQMSKKSIKTTLKILELYQSWKLLSIKCKSWISWIQYVSSQYSSHSSFRDHRQAKIDALYEQAKMHKDMVSRCVPLSISLQNRSWIWVKSGIKLINHTSLVMMDRLLMWQIYMQFYLMDKKW